ncbi:MAG TPA: SDR family oxidoreductase [Candidatus Marinimicrobia bacterium]|nr:SDR family oxidoreductase [Candidatus Neomarinimicrobiota bacterium]
MKTLITGNLGYIGPVLVNHLRSKYPSAYLVGLDTGFFAHKLTNARFFPEIALNQQYIIDIRKLSKDLLKGFDIVVHLAAISNDPIGNKFGEVTHEINSIASENLARKSKEAGVKRFVFASSCSMYGSASGSPRKETDELNPLTAYARSKVYFEKKLAELADENFVVTSLRFSTACGMSPRLRLDLVLNDFVATALTKGKIEILSDGTPWRPLIDVKDMARAIEWAMIREPDKGGSNLAVNVGRSDWNYQIKDLAEVVKQQIPGITIQINTNALPDKRSYRVDFSLYEKLATDFLPRIDIAQSVKELAEGIRGLNFPGAEFRDSEFMRLKVLTNFLKEQLLTTDLYWKQ